MRGKGGEGKGEGVGEERGVEGEVAHFSFDLVLKF